MNSSNLPRGQRSGRFYFYAMIGCGVILGNGMTAVAQQPLPSGKDAILRETFINKVLAEEFDIVRQYDLHTKDPAELREDAHRLLLYIRKVELKLAEPGLDLNSADQLGSSLLARGTKDPLLVVAAWLVKHDLSDKLAAKAACDQAIANAAATYPPRQQIDIIKFGQFVQSRLNRTYLKESRKFPAPDSDICYNAYLHWIASEADSLERQRYLWYMLESYFLDRKNLFGDVELAEFAEKAKEMKIHPWMRHMLTAYHYYQQGHYLELGNKDPREPFKKAGEQYQAAWKLAPQFPEAACQMLLISKHLEESPRLWFDRTVAAEFDHPKAYLHYRSHLISTGAEDLLKFAAETAATKRYDTVVPFEMLNCLWNVKSNYHENAWARDGVYEMVAETCQGMIKSPTFDGKPNNDEHRKEMAAQQIAVAVYADRYAEIPALWDATDSKSLESVLARYQISTTPRALKAAGEAALSAGKIVGQVEKAIADVNDLESLAVAIGMVDQAAADLDAKDRRLAQWKSVLATYRGFFSGEWGDVTFPEGFIELGNSPKWSRVDDATLVTRGSYQLPLEVVGHLPGPLEIEFDIATVAMPPDVRFAGVQIGRMRQDPRDGSQGTGFGLNSKSNRIAIVGDIADSKLKETNHVRILAWHGYLEVFVNSARVYASGVHNFDPNGYFAFCVPGNDNSTPIVRFGNVRVRQITYDSPPRRTDYEAKFDYYTDRIEREPEQLEYYVDRGDAALMIGKLEVAARDFQRVVEKSQETPPLAMRLGKVLFAQGQYQQALEKYEAVLKADPTFHPARLDLAWLQATCDDPAFRNADQAIANVQEVKKHENIFSDDRSYLTLAVALAEKGDFAKAQVAWLQAKRGIHHLPENKAILEIVEQSLQAKKPFHWSDEPDAARRWLAKADRLLHGKRLPPDAK